MSLKKKAKIEKESFSVPLIFSSHIETLKKLSALELGICVVGPACSGKSSLLRILSQSQQQEMLTVYMDSSVDSKNLIGTYVCSEVPGEFLWKTGILAHAAQTGAWILFENLDRMSEDILTLLINTVLTRRIQVPNQPEPIVPAPGFKVLGTATSSIPESSAWIQFNIDEIRFEHFQSLVKLPQSNENLVQTMLLNVHQQLDGLAGRKLILNDWKKFVNRASFQIEKIYGKTVPASLTEKCRENILLEALAVYSSLRDYDQCLEVASQVLNLNQSMSKALVENRKIQVKTSSQVLQVGISPDIHATQITSANFSINSYSARLLETLCSAVSFNENVLLIGETGCGKTSIIQYLARFTNTKLYIHNLSQTSDPTDIVGGFKPVALSSVMLPLLTAFVEAAYKLEDFDHGPTSSAKQLFAAGKWRKFLKTLEFSIQNIRFESETKEKIQDLIEKCKKRMKNSQFAFSFEEGSLVKALKEGSWVLLEEINLAEDEVLERLYSVLEGQGLTLVEKGETHSIRPAPGFRLFGCMNPGKQVGKKDLPGSLRCKFSEFLVPDMEKFDDLMEVIHFYLNGKTDRKTMEKVANFYIQMRKMSKQGLLEDGNGRPPCYTLRTLCRALKYSTTFAGHYSFPHSLYNGLKVFFETPLKTSLTAFLEPLTPSCSFRPPLNLESSHINVLGYFHEKGANPKTDDSFILTPSVKANLQALSRAVIYSNNAILLEGPTSSGKTSMVKYLSELLGHEFVRINNHEHTDIEEYIGSYVSDNSGRLVFSEGPLVKAVKNGYFLVLDELNLAPSEVLEALNRLLDDNQELFIPETQTTITPHKNFRLFATQNPTAYAGRKELSKAFRNRFVEMFIPELPDDELVSILQIKGKMAPSYANVLIQIMRDLQRHRQQTRAFMGRYGFITIRDLLKIAKREPVGYDQLAHFTYILLAERLRSQEEKNMIQEVIEKHCKSVKIDLPRFYNEYFSHNFNHTDCGIVWNFHMRRLFTLVHSAILNHEPVLLVGETGCGKTSICSALATHNSKVLRTLNCHQHTETSDFLGSLRPVRAKGILISQFFQDLQHRTGLEFEPSENSLRDVLEKVKTGLVELNERHEILAKGKKCLKLFEWVDGPLVESFLSGDYFLIDEISLADDSVLERLNSVLEAERKLLIPEKPSEEHLEIQASPGFAIFATMNPGGDYGKKELSPALRNRFTEIWVSLTPEDMSEILKTRISSPDLLIQFIQDFNTSPTTRVPLSLRDAITCAEFMQRVPVLNSFHESLALVLPKNEMKKRFAVVGKDLKDLKVSFSDGMLGIHPFFIPSRYPLSNSYSFDGPNILQNLYNLLRAMQMPKAILLEGPPGVGKTSIVEALAKVVGQDVVRINLSEETDLIDLLGCDLPVGEKFEWCDGVLLDALKTGKWVILDELNLCPQQVIEGLNALLDHRSTVFIPEINLEVKCATTFKIFGAQNPVNQGGGRKGLPKSFLNRFTKIYMDELLSEDYQGILTDLYPSSDNSQIVEFSQKLKDQLKGPWEFNLRDILREKQGARISTLYYIRLRSQDQRQIFQSTFAEVYNSAASDLEIPFFHFTPEHFYLGKSKFPSNLFLNSTEIIPKQMFLLDRVLEITSFGWPVLLVGPSGSGKSTLVRMAGSLSKVPIFEFSLSNNSDSSTLLGSFEQTEQGKFAWFDSFLLRSVKEGGWVLLKNCNKCNAAVLDRINSLLEPGGSLLVNERGLVNGKSYNVRPHPNFRVFFSYDPCFGEVSRALRNRCVEVYVDPKFSFFDLNRIFSLNLKEFQEVSKHALAKVALCKNLASVMSRKEAMKIVYREESLEFQDESQITRLEYLQSIDKFLQDPVQSYFLEDLGFLSGSSSQEAKECFLSGSCHFDVEKRCKAAGCESLAKLLPSCDEYLPVLNVENSLFHYLAVSNLVSKPFQEFLALKGLKKDLNCSTLNDLKLLWLLNRSSSQLGSWKIMKELDSSATPPLPKGLLRSYKSRRSSNHLPILGAGPLLVTEREFSIMLSGKPAESHQVRSLVKVIDEDSNELMVAVLANKESFQSEERKFLEEVFEVYEQVLFKHLLQSFDRLEDEKRSLVLLRSLNYFPQSYLKAFWMMQKGFSMKEVVLPILKTASEIPQDFLTVFKGMKETSVLDAPKFWTLCNNMLAWPKVSQRVCLPQLYVDELKQELLKCCESDEKIEMVSNRSQAASLGLWLYKLYRQMTQDPDALYLELNDDYCKLAALIESNIKTRLNFHAFRMGYEWENSLILFYRERLNWVNQKSSSLASRLRPVHAESAKFLNYLHSLPSYARLSSLLMQDQTSTSKKFLSELLSSMVSSVSSFKCPLSLPLCESLYLILFGLHSESLSDNEIFEYPIPLSTYSDHLITSHMFSSTDFLKYLIPSVISQTQAKETGKIRVAHVDRYSTEHNIGEKTTEDNLKEKEAKESKQINKIFPSFKDEALWNQVCLKEKQVIVNLFLDWQFASGRLENQLESRFLQSLPFEFPGSFLQKPLEVHLKSFMRKYEDPVQKFNFYKDPNPHESMQAYTPLVSLLRKMTEICQEFPEHAVVQEIQYLAFKALKRPIFSTPLMQMTGILEVIVLKTEDWEKFAHSGVSVKKELNEIYAVLKRWRELQMKSWENVLEETRQQGYEKEAKLWARLVRVFYVQKASGKELFEVLDEFIRGSCLGVFEFRLEMLKDFIKVIPKSQVLPVYHITAFYSSFIPQFKSFFDEQYKEIDERLKEILQIAKFKISNYLFWKDSVSKVHKQLNALVVKYKATMKLSFESQVLQKHRNSYQVNVLEHPVKLLDNNEERSDFEDLSLQIFKKLEELKEFQGKTEKKLALNDLFKELQARGFSKYYKQSDLKVFDLPRFDIFESFADLSSHERYFYACIDKMTVLQFSQTVSQDLLYEEKESCLGFSNSLMTELFTLRTQVYKELSDYKASLNLPASLESLVSELELILKSEEFRQFQLNLDTKQATLFKCPKLSRQISDLKSLQNSLNFLLIESSLPETLRTELKSYKSRLSLVLSLTEHPEPALQNTQTFSSATLSSYRSLGKLGYILLSVFLSLFTQGFCIPPELQEPDDNDQTGDGTGLGEGRGDKNITNELEDEEQFGEQKDQQKDEKQENSSEISEENQAMDVENDFQEDQKEDLQDEQSGDDKLEEAKGNEQLMDEENSMDVDENPEAQVRESANPDLTEQPDMKAGQLPEDRTGDVEDFDMQAKDSSDEEMKEQDSEEIIEVDKLSQEDSLEEDSEASEGSESQEKDKNDDRSSSSPEPAEKEEKAAEESEEEKKLDEFKSREQVKYNTEAHGNESLKANTEKVLDGQENSGKQGDTQNIISKLKSEWSESKGPSEIGPKSSQAESQTLNKVQVVNSSEEFKRPETSDLFTFTESSLETAPAASSEPNNSSLPEHLENPSKSETQIVDCNEDLVMSDSPSRPEQVSKAKESEAPQSLATFLQFQPGSRCSTKQVVSPGVPFKAETQSDFEFLVQSSPADIAEVESWQDLERETASISSELCEQLRILLEPTKAKSLKGDYKTGKRINMKKVIAYIASSYRKDKIWLRRTRQTAREYQVLLAIDDSFSMKQNGLGPVATKGLAALAQALNKLEVGQLAVGAIRAGLTVLHDFSTSFLPEDGAFVLSELRFAYGREKGNDTCYANFVTQAHSFLQSRGTSELQLVIVISDGRMNKDKVRPCLRKSEGIFYLFIIVDNQESSVFDMKSTLITKKDGKTAVKVFPYLEDFPFEYYVVVQSTELLVNVLADVVRQWFELIRS